MGADAGRGFAFAGLALILIPLLAVIQQGIETLVVAVIVVLPVVVSAVFNVKAGPGNNERPQGTAVAGTAVSVTVHGLIWCSALFVMYFIVPAGRKILLDFGIAPPSVLEALGHLSRITPWFYVVLLVVLLVIDTKVLLRLWQNPKSALLTSLWSAAMTVVPLYLLLLGTGSILLPLISNMLRR